MCVTEQNYGGPGWEEAAFLAFVVVVGIILIWTH